MLWNVMGMVDPNRFEKKAQSIKSTPPLDSSHVLLKPKDPSGVLCIQYLLASVIYTIEL